MKELIIKNSSEYSYRVYIDSTFDKFHNLLEENRMHGKDKLFFITDDSVYNIYKEYLMNIKEKYKCNIYYFVHGEENKNINTIGNVYTFLAQNHADKNSVIIALGGGAVSDIAGFAASTYMRGIRYINIPTTLISQIDTCIGGKNGYNYNGIRNIIGSFYNPSFVYVCVNFLKTLDNKQFINGIGEAVKYGAIKSKALLEYISNNCRQILERENDKLLYIVKECLSIKANIVKENYDDFDMMNILNFGHTISHGIEISSGYKVQHGEAVALGILVTLKLSEYKLHMPYSNYTKMRNIYFKMGLPVKYKVDNMETFMYAINRDRKNNESINMVLMEDFEKCRIRVPVSSNEVIRAMKESIDKGEEI